MKIKILVCTLAAATVACGIIATRTLAADASTAAPVRGRILQRIDDFGDNAIGRIGSGLGS